MNMQEHAIVIHFIVMQRKKNGAGEHAVTMMRFLERTVTIHFITNATNIYGQMAPWIAYADPCG